jgi:hypothetical protein
MKSRDYSTTLRELLASAQRKYPGPVHHTERALALLPCAAPHVFAGWRWRWRW